jgi:hypothetical protein
MSAQKKSSSMSPAVLRLMSDYREMQKDAPEVSLFVVEPNLLSRGRLRLL